ncbi:hypothetical protein M9Y10_044709 [Tritrichomonas musculus]|uniref:Protein kinase domain-containing protein n=1 Tax=Tritrichomonas musculus TaxID=1915356 RepID=A0ABR2JTJ4_9EUKA
MGNKLKDFCEFFERSDFKNRCERFPGIISKYSFIYISESENIENENLKDLFQSVGESSYLVICYGKSDPDVKNGYFVININKKILLIDESSINKLFSAKSGFSIYFIGDAKSFFDKKITIEYNEIVLDDFNLEKIVNLDRSLFYLSKREFDKVINRVWSNVSLCISGFLIMNSYKKLKKDRMNDFFSNHIINTDPLKRIQLELNKDEYIDVGPISSSFNSMVDLIYHIEKEELFALKRSTMSNPEAQKLFDRERYNYSKLNHPFIPKFIGTTDHNGIIIEYIRGHTLFHIHKLQLSEDDKLTIIFELLLVFEYLHQNEFVYRDLKPSKIIFDENKDIVLIDFDRMIIKDPGQGPDHDHTVDFVNSFCDPEIFSGGRVSDKCDIYSLGLIIYYIIFEKKPEYYKESNDLNVNLPIHKIIKQCTESNPDKRPNCSDLITYFLIHFHSRVLRKKFAQYFTHFYLFNRIQYFLKSLLSIDSTYLKDEYLKQKIKKSEYYYVFAKKQKNPLSQYILGRNGNENKVIIENYYSIIPKYDCADTGLIYDYKYKTNDELKTLSDSNIEQLVQLCLRSEDPIAQNDLGYIYYKNNNLDEAIHYFKLSADQNFSVAQVNLGYIYLYEEQYQNTEKAIHFLTSAADHNNDYMASFFLSLIYINGVNVKVDINKAIHYLEQVALFNEPNSQFILGSIYYKGEFIARDTNKAIQYLSLAANQNHQYAQNNLGFIYYSGECVTRDINRAIHFFSLAASQNDLNAINNLGYIYYNDLNFGKVETVINFLENAANKNDANAQNSLGYVYYNDFDPKVHDAGKGIHYFKLSANQNCKIAQYNLGVIYYEDENMRNIEKSIQYFSLLADQNDPFAQYSLGVIYYDLMDIHRSLYYLTLSANQNNPIALLKLGTIYYENENIRDIMIAIYYLKLSADQLNSCAMNILGYIYYTELGSRDIINSIHYFTLSSNMNNAFSQYNLGLIYMQGKYIERDINKSIHYFSLSANQYHVDACYKLGFIYHEGKYISRDIYKSIYYLRLAADMNHVDALFQLATIYLSGKYVKRDIEKGIYYLRWAAKQNYSNAQFALGIIYYSGILVRRDIDRAIFYLSLASNSNHSNAQFQLGTIYYNEKYIPRDIKKAIHYFALASNQNHPDAQFSLGLIYYSGEFVTQDINRAIYYFHLAAHQNHPDAQFSLGMIYSCGEYFTPDYKRAIDFFNQAADLNNPNAQYQLGIIYYNGEHVDQDIKAALHYLESASRQKFIDASFALGIIYYTGEHVARSIRKSIEYLTDAADMNHSNSQFALGMIYYEGYYITRNINKAIHYFSLASNNNNSNAQFILGLMYYEGIYVSRDINKSIHYYKLSSNNYNSDAQLNLGMIYYEGIYTSKNIRESIKYLQLSANQHNSIAQYQLGVFYLFGKHIKQNIHKAISYLELSANANNSNAQFVLGYVYYSEEFAELNIEYSIKYLKMAAEQNHSNAFFALGYICQCNNQVRNSIKNYVSSSNLNNVFAKNNLGVYYFKNRNIKAAIKLFKEAIEIDNDVYSLFNLARIYFYGIGVVPNISKAISLMQIAFDKKFYLAGYFLFVVYLRGDGAVKNVFKAGYLKNKILGKFPKSQSWFDDINFDEFHKFVKKYCFLQYTFKSTKNIKRSSFVQPIDINDFFYDGLGNDIYQKNS